MIKALLALLVLVVVVFGAATIYYVGGTTQEPVDPAWRVPMKDTITITCRNGMTQQKNFGRLLHRVKIWAATSSGATGSTGGTDSTTCRFAPNLWRAPFHANDTLFKRLLIPSIGALAENDTVYINVPLQILDILPAVGGTKDSGRVFYFEGVGQ